MIPTHALTLADARVAATAAEAEARANGWAVSIALCDAGGHALWLQRMDGAPLMSAAVAPEKARTSVLSGKPNAYGSIFRFEGQASVFATTDGPCYRCLYPEPPPPGLVPSCAEGGVLGEELVLVVYDDGADPNKARTFATRLVEDDEVPDIEVDDDDDEIVIDSRSKGDDDYGQ